MTEPRTSPNYRNKRFADAIAIWSGHNSVESYISFVLLRTPGMTRGSIMDDAFWCGPLAIPFLKAQAWHEAGKPYPSVADSTGPGSGPLGSRFGKETDRRSQQKSRPPVMERRATNRSASPALVGTHFGLAKDVDIAAAELDISAVWKKIFASDVRLRNAARALIACPGSCRKFSDIGKGGAFRVYQHGELAHVPRPAAQQTRCRFTKSSHRENAERDEARRLLIN